MFPSLDLHVTRRLVYLICVTFCILNYIVCYELLESSAAFDRLCFPSCSWQSGRSPVLTCWDLLKPVSHIAFKYPDNALQEYMRNAGCWGVLRCCVQELLTAWKTDWASSGNMGLRYTDSVRVDTCLENRDYGHRGSAALTIRHPSIRKSWIPYV
jgi:hypothetical protein